MWASFKGSTVFGNGIFSLNACESNLHIIPFVNMGTYLNGDFQVHWSTFSYCYLVPVVYCCVAVETQHSLSLWAFMCMGVQCMEHVSDSASAQHFLKIIPNYCMYFFNFVLVPIQM